MRRYPAALPRGYILILSLIVSAVVMTVTVGFFNYYGSAMHAERFALAGAQAQALAEAGIDKAIYELNQDAGYSGESDTSLGNGVFSVSVTSADSNTKHITVTGSVPDSARPTATRVVRATASINTSVVSFRYGVQIGTGGVLMNNGSRIEGNLFANGSVSGGGTITGDAIVAVGTDTAVDQQMTVQNGSFNIGDTSAHADVSQSFKPSVSAELAGISLNVKKIGNPGDLVLKIVDDNNGKPGTTVLGSGTIPASLITTAYGFVEATLDSAPVLAGDQAYWIIAIAPMNASNYFIWARDTNGSYSRGSAKYSSNWNAQNPAWTSITGDLGFKTYRGGALTSLDGVTVGGNAQAHTLSNCSIGGTASYQTISNCSVGGASYPGAADAAPASMPVSDAQIAAWEAAAEAGGTMAGVSYSDSETLGPMKVNGNLSVTNGATLTLTGPVWVNGNVTLSNNASLLVSPSIGAGGTVLIADATGARATSGRVSISNNVVIEGNGNASSFPMIISMNTGSEAIEMSNNASGVILYAPYGGIEVSNGTSANQITAERLELQNNATITYLSGLQNASFSNGPGGSWAVMPGTYAILR